MTHSNPPKTGQLTVRGVTTHPDPPCVLCTQPAYRGCAVELPSHAFALCRPCLLSLILMTEAALTHVRPLPERPPRPPTPATTQN